MRSPCIPPTFLYSGRFDRDTDVGWHTHEGAELVLVTAGRCQIQVGQEWLEGQPGTLFILPTKVPQYQRTLSEASTRYVVFESPAGFDDTARTVFLDLDAPVARWIGDLCELPRFQQTQVSGGLLMAVLGYLENFDDRVLTGNHPAMDLALSYMESHLDRSITVAEVATHAHMSVSHLSCLFQRQFGRGPHRYHMDLRLERAARLLVDPYLGIAAVGRACGFEDANYFARQFRRRHGKSPQSVRTENLHKDSRVNP